MGGGVGTVNLEEHRSVVDGLLADRRLADASVREETDALDETKARVASFGEAQTIVQGIAQTLQQRAHEKVAGVVTQCLNAVFEDAYEFRIRFDRKRGKTEARLTFVRDGLVLDDPLNEVGGGVIDVAALALRLAYLLLSRPPRRKLVVLDEPFRNIRGCGNKRRIRRMLLELADRIGFQFVLNVDADAYPEFRLGTVVELS